MEPIVTPGRSSRPSEPWPSLSYADWAPTGRTLHMVTQMVGKTRLALAPPQPQWLNACLYLDPRGLTTGPIPYAASVLAIRIDLHETVIRIDDGRGRAAEIDLGHSRSVADIWADYRTALSRLGIAVELWDKPQEVADTTPFAENRRDGTIDPQQTRAFHQILCALNEPFEEFRSRFFGRSGIQFWWGGFDFAVLLFRGRRLSPPTDRGYIARYDLDAEHLNAGFWPGDAETPEPRLWGYLVPRPDGCEDAPVGPKPAAWVEAQAEWVMPYEELRTSRDPRRAALDFLESIYRVAVTNGGWDADVHRYVGPRRPQR